MSLDSISQQGILYYIANLSPYNNALLITFLDTSSSFQLTKGAHVVNWTTRTLSNMLCQFFVSQIKPLWLPLNITRGLCPLIIDCFPDFISLCVGLITCTPAPHFRDYLSSSQSLTMMYSFAMAMISLTEELVKMRQSFRLSMSTLDTAS